jgi:type II secretory pathway pseudopilin PulG
MTSGMQKVFLVLTAVMLVGIVLAALVFTKAFSVWVAATRAGNEAATIQHLKTIGVVELQYFYAHQRTFGTLEQLVQEQLLSSKFKGNPVDGYVMTLTVTSDRAAFTLTADPASASDGKNHFYLDSMSRQIHSNPDKPAGPNDPVHQE